jgi:hypothetical protein
MPTKLTSFPEPRHEPALVATKHGRVIVSIGRQRFAIEITSTVSELKPQAAKLISIETQRRSKDR